MCWKRKRKVKLKTKSTKQKKMTDYEFSIDFLIDFTAQKLEFHR